MCIDVLGDTPASQFVFVGLFYECILCSVIRCQKGRSDVIITMLLLCVSGLFQSGSYVGARLKKLFVFGRHLF